MNLTRRVAALATLPLLVAGPVGVAAGPASAADEPSLTWSFSQYLQPSPVGLFTSYTVTSGAEEGPDGIIFGGGEGTGSLESGDLHLSYDGGVTFSWHVDIRFSNPEVIVEGDEGRIVADVSWARAGTGSADDVVLTRFDPATAVVDGDTFTATPDWTSTSWAPELLAALPDSMGAYFYATGVNPDSDDKKAPASFTSAATAEAAAGPTVAVESSYEGRSVLIDVDGSRFDGGTPPIDDGVYVALAPAGSFPETDDFEDQEKVADAEWVPAAAMLDGTFSVTMDPESQYLDPSQQYAVYTWQAHSHSNPSQDTETAVEIMWSNLAGPTTMTAKVAKAPTTKKAGKLTAKVTGGDTAAAGKVMVKLTKKGQKAKNLTAKVVGGAATVKLPKLAKGTWKAKVSFIPSTAVYKSATKTLTFKVR